MGYECYHGDVIADDPTQYYCDVHRTTHDVVGVIAQWSDLWLSRHPRIRWEGIRPEGTVNIFRDVARQHLKQNASRWAPYFQAPKSFACQVATMLQHRPMAILLADAETVLADFPGSFEALRAYAFKGQPTSAPARTHEETRKRIYLHGDLNEGLPRYFCEHHNAWHPTPAPSPLPGDVYRARRAQRFQHDGRTQYRPNNAKCAFDLPIVKGRPKRLPTTHELLWVCVANNTPIITE